MEFYNHYILPNLTHWVCSHKDITYQRKKVIPLARGRVLEIGIGSGLNLPFYDRKKIDFLWGLDPSKQLRKIAEKKAADVLFKVDFIGLSGEEIPLEKNSADTVVVTYTLCSIPDVLKALNEMNRVLKPGGELLFCEHGKAPDTHILQWQNRLNPIWKRLSGGCHLNRPVPGLLKKAGFKIQNLDMMYTSNLKLISFNYLGTAVAR
ncbi:MAG: class I SAM-dependent methyltransferase [Deltaproteobacteria bacterium]|nr:class I SAM-dependent methyltransferase [Deltaproteobacteria bacterium]